MRVATESGAPERRRLVAVRKYGVLPNEAEPTLDDLAVLAAQLLAAPWAYISFIDDAREWLKSAVGPLPPEIPREASLCAQALHLSAPLMVPDTLADPRFATNVLVSGPLGVRFCAAAPLLTAGGEAIGALAVLDRVPRQVSPGQADTLAVLARQVMTHLELRSQAHTLADREEWLRAILDHEPDCVKLVARDGSLIDMNPAGLRMIEADSLQQVQDRDLLPLIAPSSRVAFSALTRNVFNGDSGTLQFEVIGLKGGRRWLETQATPLRDRSGAIVALLGITRDVTEQRRARETHERFQAAQRNARIGSWRLLGDGTMIWSDEMYEVFGMPRDQAPTREAALARIHPDDLEPYRRDFNAAVHSGATDFHGEYRIKGSAGNWIYGETLGKIHRDADGKFVEAVGTVQDITERKNAERRILKLNRAYAMSSAINEMLIRQRAPDALLSEACRIAVESGKFAMAWAATLRDGGPMHIDAFAGNDGPARDFLRKRLDGDSPAGCAYIARSLHTGQHAVCNSIADDPLTERWRDAARECGYESMAVVPLRMRERVVGMFGIYGAEAGAFDDEEIRILDSLAADISFVIDLRERDRERARAEAERRTAEELFRLVVESTEEVFWIIDPLASRPLYVSPAYDKIWGRSRQELYASPTAWIDAIHPDDRERVRLAARNRMTSGAYDETYRIIRPDGSVRWIRGRAFPVFDSAGALQRIVGAATDLTEQRELEAQFHQVQKMESIGRLAGGIAHDFNNLLTVINGMAEMALSYLKPADPLRADIEQIHLAGSRAARLTGQLLALSRKQILKPEVLDLSIVVKQMQPMLQRLLGEDIQLIFAGDADLRSVKADPGQMEQVLLNLAVNARDAMPNGGTLTIETHNVHFSVSDAAEHATTTPGEFVMVAVSDTGVGMDEATRQRVFEPFFTTKESGKGTGLGLSTVYGIIKQSGGTIWVYSEPHRGTTFKIYLPRVEAKPTGLRAAPEAQVVGGTETILIVEDEEALRGLAKRVLETFGYHVLEASNGGEALLRAEQHRGTIHLMITDVVMPGMLGSDLAARLAGVRPEMKILFTSGYADEAILRHGVLADLGRFISKPFSPIELRRKVREILDS